MKNIIIFLFMIPFLLSASDIPLLQLIQGADVLDVEDMSEVEIDRKPFIFRFPLEEYDEDNRKWYSSRITASLNDDIFSVEDGMDLYSVSFFSPGAGLATSNIYSSLYINDRACHYIIFSADEPVYQRAVQIGILPDGRNLLEWEISYINSDNNSYVEDTEIQEIFLIYFVDRNLNNILDSDEYIRFRLKFK